MTLMAGKLRHRIQLQSATETKDAYGELTQSWSTYETVWAKVEKLSGREIEHAKQISADSNCRITIRYNSSVETEHRVLFNSKYYEITAIINPDTNNEYLQLYCKQIAGVLARLGMHCVSWWRMNDRQNDTAVTDSMDYSDGTSQQNTSVLNRPLDKAMSFNGSDDYVDCNDVLENIFQDSFSIVLWCKAKDGRPSSSQWLFGSEQGESSPLSIVEILFDGDTPGSIGLYYRPTQGGSYPYLLFNSGVYFDDGEIDWAMITITVRQITPTTAKGIIYINGQAQANQTRTITMSNWSGERNQYIGAFHDYGTDSALGFFDGLIKNVMLFNKVITAEEVGLLYNGGDGIESFN